jgi:signal transduction histidine kinase
VLDLPSRDTALILATALAGALLGGGLGLAIVRGLAEAHGGRVDVANTYTGCRFVVHLPTAYR